MIETERLVLGGWREEAVARYEDVDELNLAPGDPLRRHILYRIARPA